MTPVSGSMILTSLSGSGRPMVRDWSSGLSSRLVWVITPCSSVWPKTMLNWQPNASLTRVTSSAGTKEAPDMRVWTLLVSRFSKSG